MDRLGTLKTYRSIPRSSSRSIRHCWHDLAPSEPSAGLRAVAGGQLQLLGAAPRRHRLQHAPAPGQRRRGYDGGAAAGRGGRKRCGPAAGFPAWRRPWPGKAMLRTTTLYTYKLLIWGLRPKHKAPSMKSISMDCSAGLQATCLRSSMHLAHMHITTWRHSCQRGADHLHS
jgi:hypothetical protein